MTRAELRILYLLRRESGSALRSTLTQQMHYLPAESRDQAFASLEKQELIYSMQARSASQRGGAPMTRYWLTEGGIKAIEHLIDTGELKDPLAAS